VTEPNPGALAYDAPLLRPGEGTSEVQRTIVARGPARRWEDERDGT
jgi:hypothetical protein